MDEAAVAPTHFVHVLGRCQVMDYVLAVTSAEEEVEELGAALLEAIGAQGTPHRLL